MRKKVTPTDIGRSGGLLRGVALPAPFINSAIIHKLLLGSADQSNP